MAKQTDRIKAGGMSRPEPSSDDREPAISLRESHALDDENLVNNIQNRLDDLDSHEHSSIRTSKRNPALEDDEDVFDDDLDTEDEDLDAEEGDDPGESKQDSDADEDSDDEDSEDEDIADSDTDDYGGLPDALVRSAVAMNWGTKDEAIKYYQEDPQRALEVFNRIYRARLQATTEFSRLGQAARLNKEQGVEKQAPAKTVTQEQIDNLRKTFGDDATPLIDIIQSQQEMLNNIAPQPKAKDEPPKEPSGLAEESLATQQINQYFSSDDMKPWNKLYGRLEFGQGWEDLTPTQQRFRHSVLVKANDVLGGARLHGREMEIRDALEEAHLVVTQQYRDEVMVGNLKNNAVKRHKAISVKPSKSKSGKRSSSDALGTPGKRTVEQRERAVAAKLSKIFK